MARHWVGTSGWSYPGWRGLFYPRGLKQGDWIGHYAEHLRSVEVNATFYRLPQEKMLRGWVERTPDAFLFAVKGWRGITHFKRLRNCADSLETFLDRLRPLKSKCGPVLFQLPPRFDCDLERLKAFLALLPRSRRFAFEFRDPRWHVDAVYGLLESYGAAFCPFELGRQRGPRVATADFVYVRLHGRKGRYRGRYSKAALADWAEWLSGQLSQGRDAYVYFDNTDEKDFALRNAQSLEALLAGAAD